MKALVILNNYKKFDGFISDIVSDSFLNEAIKELEEIKNENKSLVKTLEKYNEEMIELRKENEDLKERSK